MISLDRFVTAQAPVIATVRRELREGRKRTHWMWFVFPQLAGLGSSEMTRRYAIASLAEARAYLAHPILGERLRECIAVVTAHRSADPASIFGSIDAVKLRSSLTLFEAAGDPMCGDALEQLFASERDPLTLAILANAPPTLLQQQ